MTGAMITDFHSHILPGVDDGSDSIAQSVRMLQTMKEQQIPRVVATPHFYASHDNPQRFLNRRRRAMDQLQETMGEEMPEIVLGAEVRYFDGLSDCDELEELTIEGTSCLLVEMPGAPWTDRMYHELQEIWNKRSITPIMAHVDRYISPWNTHGIPERLSDLPVLVQANSNFFLGRFSRPMALKMLKEGQIHCLGSDCHNTVTRPPNLGKAVALIKRSLGYGVMEDLCHWEAEIFHTIPRPNQNLTPKDGV